MVCAQKDIVKHKYEVSYKKSMLFSSEMTNKDNKSNTGFQSLGDILGGTDFPSIKSFLAPNREGNEAFPRDGNATRWAVYDAAKQAGLAYATQQGIELSPSGYEAMTREITAKLDI